MTKHFKKALVILLSFSALFALAGCSSNKPAKKAAPKEIWPTVQTNKKALKISNNLDEVNYGLRAEKYNYVRYSDVLNFKNPTKYTGTAMNLSGTVFQKEKYPNSNMTMYFVDGSGQNKRTYIVATKTNKDIRTKDYVDFGTIISGPVKYNVSKTKQTTAILGFARSNEVKDMGEPNN